MSRFTSGGIPSFGRPDNSGLLGMGDLGSLLGGYLSRLLGLDTGAFGFGGRGGVGHFYSLLQERLSRKIWPVELGTGNRRTMLPSVRTSTLYTRVGMTSSTAIRVAVWVGVVPGGQVMMMEASVGLPPWK